MPIIPKYELSAEAMREITQQTVQEHLSIEANGYRCNSEMLVDVLLQAAILACPIRGKDGGTKALCKGRKSYRTSYTFTDGTNVEIVMVATLPKRRGGKRARKWLAYVVIGLDKWSPKQVKRAYRRRFGIECSYRQMRRLRIITNSRNPAFRFFILGFALLLVSIWACLRWLFCRIKGRGRHRIDETRLRLHQFVCMLRRTVEHIYGVVMAIETHLSPQSVIH